MLTETRPCCSCDSVSPVTTAQPTKTAPSTKKPVSLPKRVIAHVLVVLAFVVTFKPYFSAPADQIPVDPLPPAKELPNFERVHSYLYRGGAPSAEGLRLLKEMGVKTVIDVRGGGKNPLVESCIAKVIDLNYVNIPMGNMEIPSFAKQQLVYNLLDEARQSPDKAPVFLHCAHGSDRTGFLVAVYRVTRDHWSIAEAVGEMVRRGFMIHKLGYKYQPVPKT